MPWWGWAQLAFDVLVLYWLYRTWGANFDTEDAVAELQKQVRDLQDRY